MLFIFKLCSLKKKVNVCVFVYDGCEEQSTDRPKEMESTA